jgi:F0F1-type ATP synthase delta subunit
MTIITYAKALERLLRTHPEDGEAILKNFVGFLEREGKGKLLSATLREVVRRLKYQGSEVSSIRIASAGDADKYNDRIKKDLQTFSFSTPENIEIDKTLVGGYQIISEGQRIDASHKRGLLEMYQTLTS